MSLSNRETEIYYLLTTALDSDPEIRQAAAKQLGEWASEYLMF